MNRKQRRAASRAAFDKEFRKVIEGHPDADPDVVAFWDDTREALGVEVAVMRDDGDLEVLRRREGGLI